jgi:hypothetical protein
MPENPCGDGPPPVFRWLQCNEVRGQDRRYFVIGTAEISVPGLICPLIGEYLCPTDPNWNPQIVDDIFQPLPPGREVQRLWDAAITRYGFVGPVGGWYDVDITLRVETLEEFIDYEGNLSTFDEVYAVDLDGNKTLITRGTNARIWVIKSRYRDNGGPWQQLADFSSLLP